MAVLKNKTQNNFTMISNSILRDKELSMKDRGVLCTICSLPDGWEFSISGLCAIVPDGKDSLKASVLRLERKGYLIRNRTRDAKGKYCSEIEVFTEKNAGINSTQQRPVSGLPVTDFPSRVTHHGKTVTENPQQYKNDNIRESNKTDTAKSINQSSKVCLIDREIDITEQEYKRLIANNIGYDQLMLAASEQAGAQYERQMVQEVYDFICDWVCHPRKGSVKIRDASYPWKTVRAQFLKLRYEQVAGVLNRIVDADLQIRNMPAYLLSALYSASLVTVLSEQSKIHDDYLKSYRGSPY